MGKFQNYLLCFFVVLFCLFFLIISFIHPKKTHADATIDISPPNIIMTYTCGSIVITVTPPPSGTPTPTPTASPTPIICPSPSASVSIEYTELESGGALQTAAYQIIPAGISPSPSPTPVIFVFPTPGSPSPTPVTDYFANNGNPIVIPNTVAGTNTVSAWATDESGNPAGPISLTFTFAYSISGNVYVSYSHNGVQDAPFTTTVTPLPNAPTTKTQIQAVDQNGTVYPAVTIAPDGSYTIPNLPPAYYAVSIINSTVPTNYTSVYPAAPQITPPPPPPPPPPPGCLPTGQQSQCEPISNANLIMVNFFVTPFYTISGNVFNDINKNEIYDPKGGPYTGSIENYSADACTNLPPNPCPISIVPADPSTNSSASVATALNASTGSPAYYISNASGLPPNLISGSYTVSYWYKPANYVFTWPVSGTGYIVSVGSGSGLNGCAPVAQEVTCDSVGNAQNLNFGISNSIPWIQGVSADIRWEGYQNYNIPTGKFAELQGPDGPSFEAPGILFTGFTTPDFCQGGQGNNCPNQGDQNRGSSPWVVGGNPYVEYYAYTQRTIYGNRVASNYLSILTDPDCTSANGTVTCNTLNNLPHGIYIASGNLVITGATQFGTSPLKTSLISITGTITIQGTIQVALGSYLAMTSANDMIIDKSIGSNPANPQPTCKPPTTVGSVSGPNGCTLEGIYLIGGNIILQGYSTSTTSNCALTPLPSIDNVLYFSGSLFANTKFNGATFQNNRDLCQYDQQLPTIQLSYRPDFVLNTPLILKSSTNITQELTP